MNEIVALRAGRGVPQRSCRGRVVSCHARAANVLLDDGSLLAVLAASLPSLPFGVNIPSGSETLFAALRQDMPCAVLDGGRLFFPEAGWSVRWEESFCWLDDVMPQGAVFFDGWIQRAVALARVPGLLTLLDGGELASCGHTVLPQVLSRRINEARKLLQRAQGEGNEECIRTAARLLLGAGPGLTPAGDDYLVGYLAALRMGWSHSEVRLRARWLEQALTQWATVSTTVVSVAFMKYAVQGRFSSALVALGRCLTKGGVKTSSAALDATLNEVLAHGATSGADGLLGLYDGLHVWGRSP